MPILQSSNGSYFKLRARDTHFLELYLNEEDQVEDSAVYEVGNERHLSAPAYSLRLV